MPDKKVSTKGLLLGLGAAGTAAAGTAALEGRLAERARREAAKSQSNTVVKRQLDRRTRQKKVASEFRLSETKLKEHPGRKWATKSLNENPNEFRIQTQNQRLARRAAKAAGRSMGAFGLMVGAAGAVSDIRRIDREGGLWANRFGKFVEKLTGMPQGSSGRGMTDAESRAANSL
jgi:hypothetical protein